MLQYLPTKLAEWIGENMQDELGFPDKKDPRKWSVSELNDILSTHVSELLGTRLGLLASICQSTTRYQVMTRL